MSVNSDQAESYLNVLRTGSPALLGSTASLVYATQAVAFATLATAKEQRITNLIALYSSDATENMPGIDWDAVRTEINDWVKNG